MSKLTADSEKITSGNTMTPREIDESLDRHIVGQADAKRAVAIAIRNRWRRQQLSEEMRTEIVPKNILGFPKFAMTLLSLPVLCIER